MDVYMVSVAVIGIAALAMAWMPDFTRLTGISYAIFYVFVGVLLFSLLKPFPLPNPFVYNGYALHLTEMVVVISLMGTGLKIDQPFSLKTWASPLKLVLITMVLSIVIVGFLAKSLFNFDWASAILLAAALAPTDPVLASDVQVGPPQEESKDNVRFSLTAEAGLNDGMAFPFVWLAIVVATATTSDPLSLTEWVLYQFLYKIVAGIFIGYAIGKVLAYLLFDLSKNTNKIKVNEGFVAISAALTVYGVTELFHGYGFIAVFITAITLRNYELHHKLHKKLHSFADQIERILLAIVLIAFGGSLVSGILADLTWPMAVFGLMFLFVIRPITSLAGLVGSPIHFKEKLAIGFFGIRGIGSFFYLAFAMTQASFIHGVEVWSLVAFVVLISLIIHGTTANRVMKRMEHFSKRNDH